ncbi:serine/threonine-protein kinase [Streptomyces sp. NPDC052012]|uniref:serine/threonine-protein kinase n=1 Tax=Streptomyces sp. NPDC052012 TaxID=3155051 RepID=UPI003450348A
MSTWTVPGYTESLELGSGASGRVVLALHEGTGVPVAVKYLSESLHTRPGFVRDFRAEARLLGGLDSPYVAGLYEYVESPDGAAIVMELVDGVSLRTLLARRGPLDAEAALVILKGSLLGLADAHRVGVVHRDYKPENVLVTSDGASKLVDFGIAVDSGARAGVAGTPSYMAPEQWRGDPASPATDVYAATATFFECLTGRKPYPGDNIAELALRHVDAPVPDEDVPEPVRPLVRRGLAKDPAQRPGDARAFVAELEAAAGAAYGPGWEERGRGRLAALVALLALLLPSARTEPRSATDTAHTVLRSGPGPAWARGWKPTRPGAIVAAAAAILAIVLAYTAPPASDPDAAQAAEAFATTSARPGVTEGPTAPPTPGSASSAAPPADSAAPSTSPGGPSDTGTTPGADTDAGGATDPDTGTDTGTDTDTDPGSDTAPEPPTDPTTDTTQPTDPDEPPSDTTPDAPAVKDVTVTEFRQTGPTTATTTVTVQTDGPRPVSVSLAWFAGDSAGKPGTADGPAEVFLRSGATQYTITAEHAFQTLGCYWTVQASTTPASADGGASQQLLTRRCDLR